MIKVKKVLQHVYVLKDSADCYANLIVGKEKALLFDTGCGIDDIFSAIREITSLPLIIIASHGHFDHIGGCQQFDKVYLSESDLIILESYSDELLNKWLKSMSINCPLNIIYKTRNWRNIYSLDFDSFDLGELPCQVVSLQGHTKGSIGIYIPNLKLLLSGDALTPLMFLNFDNHTSIDDQYETLKRIKDIEFDFYLTSHHEKLFSKSIIDQLMICIEKSKGKKYYEYQYPKPPYTKGRIYLDMTCDEPIGIVVE